MKKSKKDVIKDNDAANREKFNQDKQTIKDEQAATVRHEKSTPTGATGATGASGVTGYSPASDLDEPVESRKPGWGQ